MAEALVTKTYELVLEGKETFFTEPRVCNKSIKITLEYITRNPILIPSV